MSLTEENKMKEKTQRDVHTGRGGMEGVQGRRAGMSKVRETRDTIAATQLIFNQVAENLNPEP